MQKYEKLNLISTGVLELNEVQKIIKCKTDIQ